jgi:hypothetical protein
MVRESASSKGQPAVYGPEESSKTTSFKYYRKMAIRNKQDTYQNGDRLAIDEFEMMSTMKNTQMGNSISCNKTNINFISY